jgi:CRISPR-associated protein Csm4
LYKREEVFGDRLKECSFVLKLSKLQTHNKINRLTHTTGEGFAPYGEEREWYFPFLELSIFVLFDEEVVEIEQILTAFERMGQMGFGRDASSGMGRFVMAEEQELSMPDISNAHALYTLSPCVLEKEYKRVYFQSFVRFGRHGSFLATSKNPFKNPVLMLDEGAVLLSEEKVNLPYVGRGISGLSKVEDKTISQGYSIVFPVYFNEHGAVQ